jgi:hypothetical protein
VASHARWPPCAKPHVIHAGAPVPGLPCAHHAWCTGPPAMQRPPTPPPGAMLRAAHGSSRVDRRRLPPGRPKRRARGAQPPSHALRSPAWHACWGSHGAPPPPAHPSASSWTAMPPRPPARARRHRPVTRAMRAARAACRGPGRRGCQGACARRASRPRAAPARRGCRGGNAWASGGVTHGPPPWGSCAVPVPVPPLR